MLVALSFDIDGFADFVLFVLADEVGHPQVLFLVLLQNFEDVALLDGDLFVTVFLGSSTGPRHQVRYVLLHENF